MSEEKTPYGNSSTVKKIIGITITAERHLSADDIENLNDMLGCEVEYDDDGMYLLPDGEKCHEDFLILADVPVKHECLCDNYSELREVAEEMAVALQSWKDAWDRWEETGIAVSPEGSKKIYERAESALEKFNKLKEK